jgi:hypothetical protein
MISGKAVQVKRFYKQVSGSLTVKLITNIKETYYRYDVNVLKYLLVKVNITIMKCTFIWKLKCTLIWRSWLKHHTSTYE